jgi:hypothetical protein
MFLSFRLRLDDGLRQSGSALCARLFGARERVPFRFTLP